MANIIFDPIHHDATIVWDEPGINYDSNTKCYTMSIAGFENGDSVPLPTPNQLKRIVNDEYDALLGWSLLNYHNATAQDRASAPRWEKAVYTKDFPITNKSTNVTLYAVWASDRLNPAQPRGYSAEPQSSGRSGIITNTQKIVDIDDSNMIALVANTVAGGETATVSFIIPEVEIDGNKIEPAKFAVSFDNDNWRFSEVTTEKIYLNSVAGYVRTVNTTSGTSGYYANGYITLWSSKGVGIDETYMVHDNDVFTGKIVPKTNADKKFMALPGVVNEGIKEVVGGDTWEFTGDNTYSTRTSDGTSALNYGNVTVMINNQFMDVDKKVSTAAQGSTDLLTVNANYGEKVKLSAKEKDGAAFLGWYRWQQEKSEDNPDTNLGYYVVCRDRDFNTTVDKDDIFNQYVAVFTGDPKIDVDCPEAPFNWCIVRYDLYYMPLTSDGVVTIPDGVSSFDLITVRGYVPKVMNNGSQITNPTPVDAETEKAVGDLVYTYEIAGPCTLDITYTYDPNQVKPVSVLQNAYTTVDNNYKVLSVNNFIDSVEFAGVAGEYILVGLTGDQDVSEISCVDKEEGTPIRFTRMQSGVSGFEDLINDKVINSEGNFDSDSPFYQYCGGEGYLAIAESPCGEDKTYAITIAS